MKIEPGTTSPAQLTTDTGTVVFEGTYTACAKVMEEISIEMQPAPVSADLLGSAAKEALKNLDELWTLLGVITQQEAVGRVRQLMGTPCAEALGKASIYNGPSVSCDARPVEDDA